MRLSQEAIQRMISGRSGGGVGGGGNFDPSALAGYATQAWTEENYISKTFFNELFVVHKKVTTVVMDGETEISRTVTTDSIFAPNEIPSTTTETDEETGYVTTVTTEISSIESKKGFWTNYFISALGLNSEGGGGGLTLNEPLATINVSGLADHPSSSGQTIVWNGSAWVYGTAGGTGTVTGVKLGDVTYSPVNGIVSLPAYPSTMAWSAITGKPTTLAGYGITDAKIENGAITLGSSTITPLTQTTGDARYARLTSANNLVYNNNEITVIPTGFVGQGGKLWINYSCGTDSSDANFTAYHMGNGTRGTTNGGYADVTANGFVKNGSSDSYVLLGGGGHKLESGLSVGTASTASKLSTVSKTAWGQTYWTSGGIPTDVSGDMTGVGSITASGDITTTKENTTDAKVVATNNNGGISLLASANRGIYDVTNSLWLIGTDGTNTFLSDGNVGIGTTAPTTKLDVRGDIRLTSKLYLYKPNSDDTNAVYLKYENNGVHIVGGGLYADTYVSALGLSDSGGGGVSSLSELSDVQLSSPSNGQALIYDSSIGKWRNGAAGIDMTALTTYLTSKVLTIKNGLATLGTWNPTAAGVIDIASAVSGYLPLSGGTMTGLLKVATGIGLEDATGNGLIVYHPTNWSGVSASQWGVGAIDCQGVIRGNASDLRHYRGGTSYNIFDGYNSGIVDGHKVKLNGTSIEVPVAYNIPSPGSFTSGYWHKLGDYVTAGDNSNLVLNIYDGNGYNANAEQNSILRVVIKDGWQSTRAAADSVGVTIERFGVWAADMQISIVATDHNAGAVWIYFPWQYAAGTYVVSGNYNTWTHNSSTSSDTTTAPTTNQTKNTTGSHSYLYLDNAYTNSNVASATKLQTARLLWGNSFDGTADVNGDITITKTGTTPALMTVTNGTGTVRLAAYETNRGIWDVSGSGWLIGTGPTSSNPNTFLMRGNVGIGKSSPSYKLDVDGTINCTSIRIGGYTITADTTNQGLRINSAGLYADTYISALGANSGGGGGGGVTLNEPLSSINNASLGSPSGTDMAIVWTGSAWGYKYVPDNGGGGGGSGTVTSIKITVPTGFSISPTSAITTSGTFAITFASGYSLPTTAKQSNWDTAYNNNHQHSNKSVLDGITSAMVTKWNNCVSANDVTTQLQNYAYISSGVIHIGDASMTPLTSHQSVDGTFWGRSWSNHGTVSGSIEAGNSGGYIGGFDHIDLNTHASLLDYGGYIDFYYEGANSYTSRIIEKESGVLSINAPNVAGLLVGGYNGDYVQIGQIRIVYESSNNALRIENANNGGAANLYAMGGISALGMSGNADGTISGNLIPSANATYSIGSSSYGWKELRLSQYGVSGRITIDGDGINIVSNEGGYLSGEIYKVTGRMIVGSSDDDYDGFTFATEGTSYLSSKVSIGGTNSNSDKLYVNGTVRASSYNNSSDARLKNIISNENINIETIARAPIVRFTWKNTDDPRVHWGTLAQYWRSTEIGDIVEDGEYLAMDYAATALAGVISVARKVMTHEERIAALEAENERLKNEIETLKAA